MNNAELVSIVAVIFTFFTLCFLFVQSVFLIVLQFMLGPSSQDRGKPQHTFGHVRPAKIQIRLPIYIVRPKSSLGPFCIAKNVKFLHEDNEDSDHCADAQVDLNVRWAHMLEGTFSLVL